MDERLRKLERLVRWQWAAIGAGLVALTVGMAAPRGEIVRARRFVVVDESGRDRASLGIGGGAVVLGIVDARDRNRVLIGTSDDGDSSVAVLGPRGRAAATLVVPAEGEPFLGFVDPDGTEHKVRP